MYKYLNRASLHAESLMRKFKTFLFVILRLYDKLCPKNFHVTHTHFYYTCYKYNLFTAQENMRLNKTRSPIEYPVLNASF